MLFFSGELGRLLPLDGVVGGRVVIFGMYVYPGVAFFLVLFPRIPETAQRDRIVVGVTIAFAESE